MANHSLNFDGIVLPKTRAEALEKGSGHYFTGKPCRRGHLRPRMVGTCMCLTCNTENSARSLLNPVTKEKQRKAFERYKKTDKGRAALKRGLTNRRAARQNALPPWVDTVTLSDFITSCPEGYHIDHIIPMKAKNVCGLHTLDNLQYLPAQENRKKYNRVDPLTLESNVCVLPGFRTYVHI